MKGWVQLKMYYQFHLVCLKIKKTAFFCCNRKYNNYSFVIINKAKSLELNFCPRYMQLLSKLLTSWLSEGIFKFMSGSFVISMHISSIIINALLYISSVNCRFVSSLVVRILYSISHCIFILLPYFSWAYWKTFYQQYGE